jgi:hypothetical protein
VEEKNGSVSGNITEYVFTSQLGEATGGANNATLQYTFNTFALDQLITTGTPRFPPQCCTICSLIETLFFYSGSNYSFTITPSFLKFSLNVSSWTWKSAYVVPLLPHIHYYDPVNDLFIY